jgi:hypothetical protein
MYHLKIAKVFTLGLLVYSAYYFQCISEIVWKEKKYFLHLSVADLENLLYSKMS